MSGKELAVFKPQLPAVSKEELAELTEVSKGSDHLPRIQLITKGKYVDTGKISPGRWGIPQPGGDEITDLGETIDVVPLAFRAKALDVADREAIIAVYNTKDPEFQRIKNAPKNTGCMWGPSFLVVERTTGKMYEIFFGNASGRNEAGKLTPFYQKGLPATLGIRYKKGKEYGWHVPVITKCSEPFDPANCPTQDEMDEEKKKFKNPKEGVQKDGDSEAPEQKRAR